MAKLNMQNLPARNKVIKKLFKARPGYQIVNCDLATAEIYIAGAISGDPYMCSIFESGKDFHSMIAKTCFGLDVPVEKVKELYPDERQGSKALSFGILYGSSAYRVAAELNRLGVKCSIPEARNLIREYFKNASILKEYLSDQEATLRKTGKIMCSQGRIRYIKDVFNRDSGVVDHGVRSGLNSLFQGPSSDILLMGYTDLVKNYIRPINVAHPDSINPFTLVHDSITSEVKDELVDSYIAAAKKAIQTPRYFVPNIGVPIGVDFEIGDSWAM